MSQVDYSRISVLIVDDFSNFRSSVNSMLKSLDVRDVETGANAEEAIDWCERRRFDLVLCDYNLGMGRSGQHVLEELRYRALIDHKTVFIMVSAEASRNIVMSAYDCQPDDYLMKPINTQMLQQRMDRLLAQRRVFGGVYAASDKGDTATAIDLLVDISLEENRNAIQAQKMLGELFMAEGMFDNAEKLYTKALEVRELDWARLGLAKVKQGRGDFDVAGAWLEKIIHDNPLYLPAYDSLAQNWEKRGDQHHVQFTVQKAVDISPMSILRQKKLSEVAQVNNDLHTCVEALRRTIRLGESSCHGAAENHFTFARMVSSGMERKLELDPALSDEALRYLDDAKEWFELNEAQNAQCTLLAGRVHAATGMVEQAAELLQEASELLDGEEADLDIQLDRVAALMATGKKDDAEALLNSLQEQYADDEEALERLDAFLDEPASEANRALVAAINREGIDLYNADKYDEALVLFEKARKLFPKHIGIQLNIVQALIGKMKNGTIDRLVANECHASLELLETLIEDDNPQYTRYIKLRDMAAPTREYL